MTFPVLETSAANFRDTATVSHTMTLASGIVSGDLVIAGMACDGSHTFTWPSPWIELADANNLVACSFSVGCMSAGGGETIAVLTLSGADPAAWFSYRISGADPISTQAPEIGTVSTGAATSANSGIVTPTIGGADPNDFKWITCFGADRNTSVSTYPTGYTQGNVTAAGTGAGSAGTGAAAKDELASSDDPAVGAAGSFTLSRTDQWVAFTIAVHPAVDSEGAPNEVNDITTGDCSFLGQFPDIFTITFNEAAVTGAYEILGQVVNVGHGQSPPESLLAFKNHAPQLPGWKMTVSRVGIDG